MARYAIYGKPGTGKTVLINDIIPLPVPKKKMEFIVVADRYGECIRFVRVHHNSLLNCLVDEPSAKIRKHGRHRLRKLSQ